MKVTGTGSGSLYFLDLYLLCCRCSNLQPLFNRPMKHSDMNLMDDNQNEWEDEDPECKRFRVRRVFLCTKAVHSKFYHL